MCGQELHVFLLSRRHLSRNNEHGHSKHHHKQRFTRISDLKHSPRCEPFCLQIHGDGRRARTVHAMPLSVEDAAGKYTLNAWNLLLSR